MKTQNIIRRIGSFVMIFVMAFAITPKRTVHDLLGCHSNNTTPYQHVEGKEKSIQKDGFHCACENQEFQHAWMDVIVPLTYNPPVFASTIQHSTLPQFYIVSNQSVVGLRGPPAIA
ncbi:MAG TPA: hypothetical protein PK504_02065 [Ferruginibacter sp.]|nr:hypothetical protein [Ferruginibacter sp.]HRE63977.1 hypothetical protein [Ferruginibacter sp.]